MSDIEEKTEEYRGYQIEFKIESISQIPAGYVVPTGFVSAYRLYIDGHDRRNLLSLGDTTTTEIIAKAKRWIDSQLDSQQPPR